MSRKAKYSKRKAVEHLATTLEKDLHDLWQISNYQKLHIAYLYEVVGVTADEFEAWLNKKREEAKEKVRNPNKGATDERSPNDSNQPCSGANSVGSVA